MSALSNKNVLLGVTGGIAAYKICFLTRLFIKKGASVKIIMTPDAKNFVSPLTLSTLSKNTVASSFVDQNDNWINHVEFAKWADLMIIAPLTATTLAKLSIGLSDNLLTATYLSSTCPVFIAPAMDLDMYQHPTTYDNLEKVKNHGVQVIPAESGELASGLDGEGRMAEPETIIQYTVNYFNQQQKLKNQKILITAGSTQEAIDPVRFIGNHSTGKMGYALAEKALKLGAKVTLISGPTHLQLHHKNLNLIKVKSAEEMNEQALKYFSTSTICIAAAAVADYQPTTKSNEKIKKKENALNIELKPTPDILFNLGKEKKNQLLIGFALETDQEIKNARLKLNKKNLDFIILNSLKDSGAGFGYDTNKISVIDLR
jgi:phosphopantothenoylcysteine decarboxylase/phosphopantothenate--cysteine ligase